MRDYITRVAHQHRTVIGQVMLLIALMAVGGMIGFWLSRVEQISSLLWFQVAYVAAFFWMLRISNIRNYYDPLIPFGLYFFIRTLGAAYPQIIEQYFPSISSKALLILIVSLYALLAGASLAQMTHNKDRCQSPLCRKPFVVIPENRAIGLVSLALFMFGMALTLYIFFLWGFVPLLAEGAQDVRVMAKAGRGFLVVPAIMSMELGALLWFTLCLTRRRLLWLIVGAAVVLVTVVLQLGFGYRSPPLRTLVQAFVIFSFIRYGRILIKQALVISIALFIIVGSVGILQSYDLAKFKQVVSLDQIVRNASWRISMVDVVNLERIAEAFPGRYDFMYGHTYWVDFRALLPGPDENSGILLKKMLGLEFRGGGIVPTWGGELYLNFGWIGLVLGSFLWGFILKKIGHSFAAHKQHSVFGLVFMSQLMLVLAYTSGGMLGADVFQWLIPYAILWFIARAVSRTLGYEKNVRE